jgi:hypothetical protein
VLVYRIRSPRHTLPLTVDGAPGLPVPSLAVLTRALAAPTVTLPVLTRLLYRCDAEELDDTRGASATYNVPGHGPLAWAGFAGVELVLRDVRRFNNMGHPLLQVGGQGDRGGGKAGRAGSPAFLPPGLLSSFPPSFALPPRLRV